MKYLAFDIEVCSWPEEGAEWREIAPLGISCVGLMGTGWDRPEVYFAGHPNEPEARAMNKHELDACWNRIEHFALLQYKLVGWNSLQFDLACWYEEAKALNCIYSESIKIAAMEHIDPMFYIFCSLGWPVGLQAVSNGLGLRGKLKPNDPGETTFWAKAPELWMNGTDEDRKLILEYVGQDAEATLDIVEVGTRVGALKWLSKKGKPYSLPYNQPLTVKECLALPEKDNSWMTNPRSREDFYRWTIQIGIT